MAFRIVEATITGAQGEDLPALLDEIRDRNPKDLWHERLSDDKIRIQALVQSDRVEGVLDLLDGRFGRQEGFRAVVYDIQAVLPRPDPGEDAEETGEDGDEPETTKGRISREELYADVREMTDLTWVFVVLMVLATVVASIGLILDNVAVIIGSMVIAPLLGPNVALALSTTLADRDLARVSLAAQTVGLAIATAVSFFVGLLVPLDPSLRGLSELALRSRVTLWDVALGLAVGGAGVLSVTTGLSQALVGVMVAAALLPPLAAFGLLLGSASYVLAAGALLLVVTYLICINLAGVTAFFVQGIRPRTWWESARAKRSTRVAILLWSLVLGALVVIIWFTQPALRIPGAP